MLLIQKKKNGMEKMMNIFLKKHLRITENFSAEFEYRL